MSGRDYRSFITSHRAGEMEKLVRRATDGVGSNKYFSVDYDKLRAATMEKRFSGHKTLMKVQKIENISRQTKENSLVKQHRLVWQREFLRLNHLRKKIQTDVESHMRQNSAYNPVCSQIYQDFSYFDAGLECEFEKFKQDTADPVWNLREDLAFWLVENKEELRLGSPEVLEKHSEIMATINSVKQQQAGILDKLHHEQKCLEYELNSGLLNELCLPQLEKRPHFDDGIPEEAYDLECPDYQLKISVLEEFLVLDAKYHNRLADLDQQHSRALSSDTNGGWNEDDHFVFVAVYDQYPCELPNKRSLVLDRLKRHLPNKTRSQLVNHEDWWLNFKYFNERQKGIFSDWARDRRELLTKARVVFAEAIIAHDLEELKTEHRQKQRDICDTLYQKVVEWREKKIEAMMLESQLEEKRQKRYEEERKKEEEREKKKRQLEKEKISAFQEEKEQKQAEQEARDRQRLKELQEQLSEQAVIDRERVKYREVQLEKKREDRKKEQAERLEEEQERERRLESLREQVRVIAESDPNRLLQRTEAWEAHLAEDEEEYTSIQKPLFEVKTFTSQQVTSDPRIRLEQKLREAGLHKSDYARQVLSQVKPQHPPRKDMESTVFKYTEKS